MTLRSEIPLSVLQQYFRVPTGDLPVDYVGRPLLLGSCITNISTTGAFVRTARPLPKGTKLDIAFSLPASTAVIRASTIVRWSTVAGAGAPSESHEVEGMGVEFTKLSSTHRKLIHRFVAAFLQRMRQE